MEPELDFAELEVWLADVRESHRAGGPGSGRFARLPGRELDGRASADFAVIDYTTGPWPLAPSEQEARVAVLQGFQDPESGLFRGPPRPGAVPGAGGAGVAAKSPPAATPDTFEATAYFMRALELLGGRPVHPLRALEGARTPRGLEDFFAGLDWSRPHEACRSAAAVGECFAATGEVGSEWFDRYFAGLAGAADAGTGLWTGRPSGGRRKDGRKGQGKARRKGQGKGRRGDRSRARACLEGALGLLALHERFRRPLPRPAETVATTLDLQGKSGLFCECGGAEGAGTEGVGEEGIGEEVGPGRAELAAAYALARAFRQSGKRPAAVRKALLKLLRATAERVTDERFRDALARDPGRAAEVVSLLAELSRDLPGSIRSRRPLRLYLDRHLFV